MNESPKRKPLRLDSGDYSSAGWYFITICTQEKGICIWTYIDTNPLKWKEDEYYVL